MRKEDLLQIAISKYLSLQYPDVVFTSDASGLVMSMGAAIKAKRMRSDDKIPDLLIFEPRGVYHALLLELKVKSPYLKDGVTLRKDSHLAAQKQTLDKLKSKNYLATFCTGFDEAKSIIDGYMKNGKGY